MRSEESRRGGVICVVWFAAMMANVVAQQPAAEVTECAEGRVVDVRGEPLPAVEVQVTPWYDHDTVLARGRTDGQGIFRLPQVPVREAWGIGATSDGRTGNRVWTRPGRGPVVVQLPEAVPVRGQLIGGDGKPVVGITVAVSLALARQLQGACDRAVTDKEGRFELARTPLGLCWFTAVVPGVGLTVLRHRVTGPCEVRLDPPTWKKFDATIRFSGRPGTGLPKGSAVCLVPQLQECRQMPPPWQRLPIAADGVVVLRGLPPWFVLVRPEIPGFACEPNERTMTPTDTALEFTLHPLEGPGLRWRGTLSDALGQPVGGCELELSPLRGVGMPVRTMTAADGAFAFDLPVALGVEVAVQVKNSDVVLDIDTNGLRGLLDLSVFTGPAGAPESLALRAIPGASVRGLVLRPDGKPAQLATVTLEEHHRKLATWMRVAWVTTDLDGEFVLRGVHPTEHPVRLAVHSADGDVVGEPFALQQQEQRQESLPLCLVSAAIVEGVVVDRAGEPVVGERVWLRPWETDNGRRLTGRIVEVFTDRHGRFRFCGVPAGVVALQMPGEQENPTETAAPPFEAGPGKVYSFKL